MMLAWKIAPALACGNCVVLKSAEQTPLSALYFGNLVIEAGLPPGVINILSGYGKVAGAALAAHTDVDKIAFTGSTVTARSIMKAASTNLKNITLECGGKSPSIVFADADIEQAVKWTHVGAMDNQGQVCTSTSRIYVEESIYEVFLKEFRKYTEESTKVGGQFEDGVTQGPQVTKPQLDKIMGYIDSGRSEGARLLLGGTKPSTDDAKGLNDGYFVQPTIFADVAEDMKIMQEEIFGPVVSISKFTSQEEVIAKANNTSYGLAAAVFTENIAKGHIVASKLQAGMVWINSSNDSHYGIPFGGYKSSGIGRELGSYAIDAYSQAKAVHVNLGNRL